MKEAVRLERERNKSMQAQTEETSRTAALSLEAAEAEWAIDADDLRATVAHLEQRAADAAFVDIHRH